MNLQSVKLFSGILILLLYISIGVFGLFQFGHTTNIPMENCPFTEGNFSACNNTTEHINNWQQFSNVVVPAFFVFTFFIFNIALYFLYTQKISHYILSLLYKYKYSLKKKFLQTSLQKIARYLSLFENSPSLNAL